MEYTAEQKAAIAAMRAAFAETEKQPIERWLVLDRDGDRYCVEKDAATAERELAYASRNGSYAPYTLHHMREVIA